MPIRDGEGNRVAQIAMLLDSAAEKRTFYKMVMGLALPIIGRNLVDALGALVGLMMAGSVNQNAMAAVSLAANIQFLLSLVYYGLATGMTLLGAQYWGRGDVRTIEKIFAIALRVALSAAAVVALASVMMPAQLMDIFSTDATLIEDGAVYLRIIAPAFLCIAFTEMYLNIMRSMERVKLAPKVYFVSFLVNIALNFLFVMKMGMGITGVALAMLLSRALECAICLNCARMDRCFHVRMADLLGRHGVLTKDYLRYTLPAVGNDMAWGIGFTMYSVIIGRLSTDAIAAYSIAGVARKLGTVMCYSLSSAMSIIVGKALGAGQMDAAQLYVRRMLKLIIGSALFGGLIIYVSDPLFEHITKLTVTADGYLRQMMLVNMYYVLGQAVNNALVTGILRPGGDTRFGFVCDTIMLWAVMVPLGLVMAFVLKLPVMLVFFVLYLDEFIKMPFFVHHYRQRGWLRNITRETLT